ncbi:MAG: hypothetical protein IKC69_05910 [Clostridia bacterium]|nr:hypothetical protein [Clostridia bacterium]
MKIGLWEPFPVLERLLIRNTGVFRFPEGVAITRGKQGESYDLLLHDRASLLPARAQVVLISGEREPIGASHPFSESRILTGGMGCTDPVTFSSIGEDHALLCLQEEIVIGAREIGPFERPVPFLRGYSLFKNLAAGFALSLAEILFGEESAE